MFILYMSCPRPEISPVSEVSLFPLVRSGFQRVYSRLLACALLTLSLSHFVCLGDEIRYALLPTPVQDYKPFLRSLGSYSFISLLPCWWSTQFMGTGTDAQFSVLPFLSSSGKHSHCQLLLKGSGPFLTTLAQNQGTFLCFKGPLKRFYLFCFAEYLLGYVVCL